MLKLKDSVPLSELEKFGFNYYEKGEFWHVEDYACCANISINKDRTIDFDDDRNFWLERQRSFYGKTKRNI